MGDPVLRVLEIVEALHAHEDGIRVLDSRSYRRLVVELERGLREAFPSYGERIPEIVAALRGERAPFPPRWWQGGWEMVSPSPEEILLSVILGQRDPRYLPEDSRDPLGDAYREHLAGSELPSPESPALFGLAFLVEALLWGFYRFRLVRDGALRGLREVLRERFGADEALLDGLALLSRRHEGMSWDQRLGAFLSLPGAPQLLDRMLTLYGDLLVAKGVEQPFIFPAPVPERETGWFRRRLLHVYQAVGNVGLAAKAMRMRKAEATALIREMEGKDEQAKAS
ncbi:hypothetical protein OO015_00665 [Thermomicrobium sp. 4228-Ro]|uniref:hypothetical protein n=1 Tax=Thermomicrobium sp. 4228-Ro TaxID=2993937 RepID=UPI002248B52A|nr:hypothetical protein [Thermomicrobium sp. 4228-Ro]MCX2726019.1 hypothetical protein [Thermomicrobium sp. 4228-Ro]